MDSTYPDPGLIGKAFVKQYYTQLHHDPSQMHRFYLEQSSMIHGGSEVGSAERVIGQKAIHEKILSMDLQQVHAKIKQVDSDLTLGQGITIQVTGELSTAGKPMRAFVQTFVLAPESPKKYYVRNDFFRYQDDDISNEGEPNEAAGEGETGGEQTQDHMDTYHHQQPSSGMSSAEVMKDESALYGSPGANLVAMGDQGLQEEGGGMGAASSWTQFPNDTARMSEVQQNGLPTEEEAIGDVPTPQATPLAPPTPSSGAAQPEMSSGHLQAETDGPATEPSETYNAMETQEPGTAKGTWADRLARGFGTSAAHKPIPPSMPLPQSGTPRQAAPPTAVLPQQRGGGGGGGEPQRKRMDRTPPVKDAPPPRKMGGGPGRDMPDACQIFVGGLPAGTTEAELKELFSTFGTILEVRLNQKNFAFLVFSSQEAVQKILAEREAIHLRTKPLNVEMKRSSAPRGGGGVNRGKPGVSSGGGGGGGGGRFRPKPTKR